MSFCASCSLKRATVCLFQSSGRRSTFAGSGGPSSPGVAPSSSFSLVPVLRLFTISASDPPPPCVCIPSILSMRRNKPPPSSARLPPVKMSRRFRFISPPTILSPHLRLHELFLSSDFGPLTLATREQCGQVFPQQKAFMNQFHG